MSEILKCPKCSSDLGMTGVEFCCWNSECDFRSNRPWISPPKKKEEFDISKELEAVIGECLNASAIGPFFVDNGAQNNPYWEFYALLGFSQEEVEEVSRQWPNVDISDDFISGLVSSCFVNLLGYPHRCEKYWLEYFSVSREQLAEFGDLWCQSKYVQNT